MGKELTARQRTVYLAIREQIINHNKSPTLEELSKLCGWPSRYSSRDCVIALVRKGYITREKLDGARYRVRGIRLTEDICRTAIGTYDPESDPTRYNFAVLFEEPEHFFVIVEDDQLRDVGIDVGDVCIASRKRKPVEGCVVAVAAVARGTRVIRMRKYTAGMPLVVGVLAGLQKAIHTDPVEH